MKYAGTVTGRFSCKRGFLIDINKIPKRWLPKRQPKVTYLDVDFNEIERRLIRAMALTRLQWLTLWDEMREYFHKSHRVIRWDKNQIIAKMDELERDFIRRQEKEDRDYGSPLD